MTKLKLLLAGFIEWLNERDPEYVCPRNKLRVSITANNKMQRAIVYASWRFSTKMFWLKWKHTMLNLACVAVVCGIVVCAFFSGLQFSDGGNARTTSKPNAVAFKSSNK